MLEDEPAVVSNERGTKAAVIEASSGVDEDDTAESVRSTNCEEDWGPEAREVLEMYPLLPPPPPPLVLLP